MGKGKITEGIPADVLIQLAKSQATKEPEKSDKPHAMKAEETQKSADQAEAKADKSKKEKKAQTKEPSEEPQEKPKNERKRKSEEEKRGYRINLALRMDIGEEVKRMADAENRSVNNYIEQLILDHLKNRKEKP